MSFTWFTNSALLLIYTFHFLNVFAAQCMRKRKVDSKEGCRKENNMVKGVSLSQLFEPFFQLTCEALAGLEKQRSLLTHNEAFCLFVFQKNNMHRITSTHGRKNFLKQTVISIPSIKTSKRQISISNKLSQIIPS